MGYNSEDALRTVIDIETVPLVDVEFYLDPIELPVEPDLALITPAKNLVDPVKMTADLEKRKQAAVEAYREQCRLLMSKRRELVERCALDVDLCQIVALGWQREDRADPVVCVIDGVDDEVAVLTEFWHDLGQRVTVGYNTLGFDLPVLLRRSLYLGVQTPAVSLDKYRTNHLDLQMRMSFNGLLKFRSLSFYCKRFGIPCDDETTGADIGELVKAGQWDAVAKHCRSDVQKTKALAEKIGLLKQQPALAEAGGIF